MDQTVDMEPDDRPWSGALHRALVIGAALAVVLASCTESSQDSSMVSISPTTPLSAATDAPGLVAQYGRADDAAMINTLLG